MLVSTLTTAVLAGFASLAVASPTPQATQSAAPVAAPAEVGNISVSDLMVGGPGSGPRAWITWSDSILARDWFKLYGAEWKPTFTQGHELEHRLQQFCGDIHFFQFKKKGKALQQGRGGWWFRGEGKLNSKADRACLVEAIQAYCPGCDGSDTQN